MLQMGLLKNTLAHFAHLYRLKIIEKDKRHMYSYLYVFILADECVRKEKEKKIVENLG